MESELIAALVGAGGALLGAILGFAASYILEARKKKWAREDQWRERERADLENVAERYRRLIAHVIDVCDHGLTLEARENAENFATEPYTNPSLINDDELWRLARELSEQSTRFVNLYSEVPPKDIKARYKRVLELSEDLQSYINSLIKQTYKKSYWGI